MILAAGMRAAAATVNLVLVSFLLAMTFFPIVDLFTKRGMKRGLAVLLTVLAVLVGGLLLTTALAASLSRMSEKLPVYQTALSGLMEKIEGVLAGRGIDLQAALGPDPARIVQFIGGLVRAALSALGYGTLVLILVALILLEMPLSRHDSVAGTSIQDRFADVASSVRRFVGLTGILGGVQAGVALVTMLVIGTDFPIVWAVLLFFLNFVPFGFAIGLLVPLALTLLEKGVVQAVVLFVVCFVANLISDNVVKPKVMGQGLGLSPLLILIAFMLWAYVLGPMGAVLAIPLTIAIDKTLPLLTEPRGK
ncbi:MAG TPA: AI-2E family transporter [Myxococcales bacterium]|nr:AI-2E family transporter [Myxococcales bacterium]